VHRRINRPKSRVHRRINRPKSRVHRRINRPKRDEVTRGWKQINNKQLHNFYSSPNIFIMIMMMKSSGMIWTRHAARTGEMRNEYRILIGKPEGKRPFGRNSSKWEIFFWILEKRGWRVWIEFIKFRIVTGDRLL
jgi:hypothetical protein